MPPPFSHVELHRRGIGLAGEGPEASEITLWIDERGNGSRALRICTCAASKKATCAHLRDLSRAVAEVQKVYAGRSWEDSFAATAWYRLAHLCFESDPQAASAVRVRRLDRAVQGAEDAAEGAIRITSPAGGELARYFGGVEDQTRLLERAGKVATGNGHGVCDRAEMLERLALFQVTREERVLNKAGVKTRRQSWEASFWHRLAYHCVRELAPGEEGTFHPAVDEGSGAFTLTYRRGGAAGPPMVRVTLPRDSVRAALALLAEAFPQQEDLTVRPLPLRSIFHVSEATELDLAEVRPVLAALQATGEERFLELAEVEKFRWGNLVWLKDLQLLAEIEREGRERKFRAPVRMTLQRHQIPGFLAEHTEALAAGVLVLDAPLRERRRIWKTCERIEISAAELEETLGRSWYWLAVEYGFGNGRISLAEILAARRAGVPYLEVPGGWLEVDAPAFRGLGDLFTGSEAEETRDGRVRLSVSDLLRLQAGAGAPLALACDGPSAAVLDRLLHLRPAAPFRPPRGLATALRVYQERGAEWLRFLHENRLGGLLCDDMGLGKTLQTLALMASLHEEEGIAAPFLVACPTSVLSHWRDQIRRHAPGLKPVVHHGPQRRLAPLSAGDVLVTSHGVLRRDVEQLAAIPFGLAVFDEIQQLKNRQTQAWQAAAQITAPVRLGLTGTPIENSLTDLKTLFDLVLPGYLGSDTAFEERYVRLPEARGREVAKLEANLEERRRELARLISPFVLRRLKSTVLDELPAKIEDVRTCVLSEDQVALYRDAIEGRGAELARQIEAATDEPLPYIHVFALLNLLKQICDHPALALGRIDHAEEYSAGKWDLFRELLDEALGNGQKVVVFTQFLGMITLMERHLTGLGVDHATLTGATTQRGEVVDRFNQDPDCRVFLGSLKAGGTGIDLIAGSVVIHYDRWWNAAREDQATDRVHRLGQQRAVQVFKLITEGTLEEKISAVIERKRRMMASVVQEDDPKLAKIFTRDELIEMLRGPGAGGEVASQAHGPGGQGRRSGDRNRANLVRQ